MCAPFFTPSQNLNVEGIVEDPCSSCAVNNNKALFAYVQDPKIRIHNPWEMSRLMLPHHWWYAEGTVDILMVVIAADIQMMICLGTVGGCSWGCLCWWGGDVGGSVALLRSDHLRLTCTPTTSSNLEGAPTFLSHLCCVPMILGFVIQPVCLSVCDEKVIESQ